MMIPSTTWIYKSSRTGNSELPPKTAKGLFTGPFFYWAGRGKRRGNFTKIINLKV